MKEMKKNAKLETKCLHAGYTPKNGEPRVMPIVQSTTYVYDSTNSVADVFDDPTLSLIYSRFETPTTDAVEKKIAALEGGAAAMCTSSGQAASLLSILNICEAGDSFIASSSIYGGTINLFGFTLKKMGIECIWVDVNATEEELNAASSPTPSVFSARLSQTPLSPYLTLSCGQRPLMRTMFPLSLTTPLQLPFFADLSNGALISLFTPPQNIWTATLFR